MHADASGFDDPTQWFEQVAVDLHGVDLGTRLDQSQSERSQTGTDLEDEVTLADVGEPRDSSHRIGIDHEVLTEGPRRVEAVFI
jgi:hypothetical protein